MTKLIHYAFIALTLALAPVPGMAQDFAVGQIAAGSGDYVTALREWQPLAEQGHLDAQLKLAGMYAHRLGVWEDKAEAARWYRLAAAQGNADAQNSLGWMYRYGEGVPKDYINAHMWFTLAGVNGNNDGVMSRLSLSSYMTAEAVAEAQRLARVCMESDYQDCGAWRPLQE